MMETQKFITKAATRAGIYSFRLYFALYLGFRIKKFAVLYWNGRWPTKADSPFLRLSFYSPETCPIKIDSRNSLWLALFSLLPIAILICDTSSWLSRLLLQIRPFSYNVDPRINPMDGWEWAHMKCAIESLNPKESDLEMMNRFICRIQEVKGNNPKSKVYLFGTGPSLEKARDLNWEDGYRVVCNTIVRDQKLFHYLNPDFIAAGDGIYHFGHTEFAAQFRRDLLARLKESKTYFVFPKLFWPIVQREFGEVKNQLISVPLGSSQKVHSCLSQNFELPALGNALALLLLPIGCCLSKDLNLWGFDGRAPTDKLFWSNSSKHSYPELMSSLISNHPAFFDHHVPKHDPFKYVRSVLGDELEHTMAAAEREGWRFSMLHHSWTPALAKRQTENSTLVKNQAG